MHEATRQPLRLVLDTNVVAAGLLWNAPLRRLIGWAIEGKAVELFSSPVLLDELAHTLAHSKFASRIQSFGNLAIYFPGPLCPKQLLLIRTHQGIAIVTAREVVNRLDTNFKA